MARRRWIAGILVFLSGAVPALAKENPLSRSIYIPVVFSVPSEIASELLIWIGDEEVPRRAERHTFLFTYFPEKGDRFFPEQVDVRLRAPGVCDGADLDTNFIISPWGIQTGEGSLTFDRREVEKQVRSRHRDVRVKAKIVNVRCQSLEKADSETDGPKNP